MKRKLTLNELEYVQREVRLKGKSTVLAYVLAILLGTLGIHLGYLERIKSAVVRFLLTLSTVALLFLVSSTVEMLQVGELTMRLQQYSSALSVALTLTLITQLLWIMYDLVAIPRWVRETNDKIEEASSVAVMQGEYAAENIREEESSHAIVNKVYDLIRVEIDETLSSAKERIESINNDLIDKESEIAQLSDELTYDLESVRTLSYSLKENIEEIQDPIEGKQEIDDVKESMDNAEETEEESSVSDTEVDSEVQEETTHVNSDPIEANVHEQEKTTTNRSDDELDAGEDEPVEQSNEHMEDKVDEAGKYSRADLDIDRFESEGGALKDEMPEDDLDADVLKAIDELKSVLNNPSDLNDPEVEIVNEFNGSINPINQKDDSVGEVNHDGEEKPVEDLVDKEIESKPEPTSNTLNVKEALESDGVIDVEGYIVGLMNSDGTITKFNFKNDSNLVISDSIDNTDDILVVQVSKRSNLRDRLGLKSSPANLGRKVIVSGRKTKYFNMDGIKNPDMLKLHN